MKVSLNPSVIKLSTPKELYPPVPQIIKSISVADSFIKNRILEPPQKGIEYLSGIKAGKNSTVCDGSLGLINFWSCFSGKEMFNISKKGLSTNDKSYPDSFLKTTSDRPISTSAVRDCSVMYLYNDKEKTHSLFHAAHDTDPDYLNFILKTLMPEGITHGAIIPGRSSWYYRHEFNMKMMFCFMKMYNENTVVNVYHSSTTLPEIVGYKGNPYEIPNRMFLEDGEDVGQASFPISDLQGHNTFQKIEKECQSVEDVKRLKSFFRKQKYDEEIIKIFDEILDKKAIQFTNSSK